MASNVADRTHLEQALAIVGEARDWDPPILPDLTRFIEDSDDRSLFRVNPLQYAPDHDLSERDAIDLFLHASKAGLFEMEWTIVCESCGNTFKSFRELEKVDPHFSCNVCSMDNEATLDDYIQVTFTVAPSVRDIVYHHPELLEIEDRIFNYQYSASADPIYGQMRAADLFRAMTVKLEYLDPGDTATVRSEIHGGSFVWREVDSGHSIAFVQSVDRAPSEHQFSIEFTSSGFHEPDHLYGPYEIDFPMGHWVWPMSTPIGPGALSVECTNRSEARLTLWAVQYPEAGDFVPKPVEFESFLSAKRLLSTQTFLRLFRSQVPPEGESLSVTDLTYLFTDLKGSTSMYDDIGDASAYNVVRLHFDVLGSAVVENNGAIVKTIGDAVMATFLDPRDAVAAAFDMFSTLGEFNRSMSSHLGLKVGIHRGHSIAVNLNGALDYFGQNVNIAARTEGLAGSGEILITDDVLSADGVQELLDGRAVERVEGDMKGVTEVIGVSKIGISQGSASR